MNIRHFLLSKRRQGRRAGDRRRSCRKPGGLRPELGTHEAPVSVIRSVTDLPGGDTGERGPRGRLG